MTNASATRRMTRPRVPSNETAITALSTIEPQPEKRAGQVFKRANGEGVGPDPYGIRTAVRRAGLPDFRFHDLRHTGASHLATRGWPLKEIQEVLGHKSFSMTLRYAHLSPAHLRMAVEPLAGLTALFDNPEQMADKMAKRVES
jgi:integrase